ncbi:MAG: sialate O-acetylesterase [Fidelibacterota bacterium]|nr:MAG: sialate O-acetylesterase [Candidatus Neomarinimicrobiota bacterium]
MVWTSEKTNHTDRPDAMMLYLLMGQSNMAGRGKIEASDWQTHPRVYALNAANEWVPAREPVHFDKPHLCGTGPAMTFARVMVDEYADETIGLIPCAMGGSTLAQWQKGRELYDATVSRARVAMEAGRLCGMLWHQGESDAMRADAARNYGRELSQLIRDLRQDLECPDLPVVVGQLGDFLAQQADRKWHGLVNKALSELPTAISNCACAAATGLGHNAHDLHFDAAGSRELGRRFALAMLALTK